MLPIKREQPFARPLSKRMLYLLLVTGQLVLGTPTHANSQIDVAFQASTPYEGTPVTLTAELHKPHADGPFPAVVLMHGCGGLTSAVQLAMRRHAAYFVEHNFVALILDSFGPRGNDGGWVCGSGGRLFSARLYRKSDALDALSYLQSLDFVDRDNIFQMGQSNGASVAILLAQSRQRAFRATSAFYPWCGAFSRIGLEAELTTPLVVFAGALDDWTPPELCNSIEASGAAYKVVTYPGAVHSFDLEVPVHTYHGHKVGHDADATRQSREQMLNFFVEHMTEQGKARMPLAAQLEAPTKVFLTGAEIRQLMPTGALKGINKYGNPFAITGENTNYQVLKGLLEQRGSSLINETLQGPTYLRRSGNGPRAVPPLPVAQNQQK